MTMRKWSALFVQGSIKKPVVSFITHFKLVLVASVLAISALASMPSAYAVGLGEVRVNSSLNEPLAASIQIIKADDLQDNQLLVSLASPEAFERAGVSRDFFLSRLQFSVGRDSSNQRVINVVTDQPVVEPYLDFLVQLQWPEGRVMRSYTLLLDLPIYREDQSSAVQVTPPRTDSRAVQSEVAETSALDRTVLSGDRYQVIVGDTLWNVAERLRPSGATILQTMDSLYQQNSSAFSNGDANRLMKGAVLRLPTLDQIRDQAGDMVASQIGLVAPVVRDPVATVNDEIEIVYSDEYDSEADVEPAISEESDARLQLVSASEEAAESWASEGSGERSESGSFFDTLAGETVQQLSSDLAVANDEVNKFQLENSELRERLALLEAQVATMAGLVEQAQKQADLDRAATVPAKAEDNLSATLLAVPAYFWAALIALVLFIVVLVMRKSSSSSRDEDALSDELPVINYESYDSDAPNKATAAATLHDLEELELDPDDDLFDESDTEIFDSMEETVGEEMFDMMVEAVAEAEVYLSLGNTPQAIAVLEDARAEDPSDASSRLKLMEILFREGRRDELGPLYDEILLTEDSGAIEMAAIIAGPQNAAVKALDEDASGFEAEVSSELDSFEFEGDIELESSSEVEDSLEQIDSPEPIDSPEQVNSEEPVETDSYSASIQSFDSQHPELKDLGFSDTDLAALELDDVDIDALDIQDFDIDLEDFPKESKKAPDNSGADADATADLKFPGSEELDEELNEELNEELDEMLADFATESSSTAAEAPAEDAFSALDDINSLDSAEIKLDLAKTYVEMGDPEGAKEILEELISEADEEGKAKAQALLASITQ